jgi:hypothetical protein
MGDFQRTTVKDDYFPWYYKVTEMLKRRKVILLLKMTMPPKLQFSMPVWPHSRIAPDRPCMRYT